MHGNVFLGDSPRIGLRSRLFMMGLSPQSQALDFPDEQDLSSL